ncbi:hypothetical protein K439DRAFT_1621881 [Ramaria rubella]|nr:hypothetical protein K439DRAFT_1621881 [Ramaria rubella]
MHVLVQHTDPEDINAKYALVPCVVGMSIPRNLDVSNHAIFMLSHFKPFSIDLPLLNTPHDTFEAMFHTYEFHDHCYCVIANWEALYECQDKRDADRLKHRSALACESCTVTEDFRQQLFSEEDEIVLDDGLRSAEKDFRLQSDLLTYKSSGWLDQ